jgi:hypothetical protein
MTRTIGPWKMRAAKIGASAAWAVAFVLLATAARGETLVGLMASGGLGEGKLAPYIEQRANVWPFRLSAQGELSHKVESGRGYRLGADAEWFGPVVLSASFRHRDGGDWTKHSLWLGAGIGGERNRLTLRREMGHQQTFVLTNVLSWRRLETQASVYRYVQQGTHHGATLLVGFLL